MSGVSGSMALSVYLSTIKDEPTQIARKVTSDPQLARIVAGFRKVAPSLTTAAAILNNYSALKVIAGAYNLGGQIGQTAVLRDLMTQDPDGTTSLVNQAASVNYLHFARATSDRTSQTVALGNPAALSLTTTGAAASSLTVQNTAWGVPISGQTKALPGVQWSFVLNDGSAGASIAAALTAAAASTTDASGAAPTYSVSAAGIATGSAGAPAITTSKDSAGNTVYSLALAKDSSGDIIKRADIVSVAVTAGASSANVGAQVTALAGAATAAGFDTALSASGSLSIIDPAGAGTMTLARGEGSPIAVATANTLDSSGRLALGDAGKALTAGQVLTDGTAIIGTVGSVDSFGNVTLTAKAATPIAAGDSIDVAIGLNVANAGTAATTTAATASGATVLGLGHAGIGLKAGQIVTSGGVAIGTIARVDKNGNATLLKGTPAAVAAGARLVVLSPVVDGITHALSDKANIDAIVAGAEINSYETKMGAQYAGMDDALYYTRTMGHITSINQLMSDPRLLSVVTTGLGMGSYFGALDFNQQVRILTQKVDLKTATTPAGIKRSAEQYLIAKAATVSTAPTGMAALLAGVTTSSSDLLSLINGGSISTSAGGSSGDPILSLFA